MCEPQIVTIMADSGVAMLVNVRRHQGPAQHWGRRLTRGLFCKVLSTECLHLSQIRMLNPNSQALGGGVFVRLLGLEGGSLMNGINFFVKETQESSLTYSSK